MPTISQNLNHMPFFLRLKISQLFSPPFTKLLSLTPRPVWGVQASWFLPFSTQCTLPMCNITSVSILPFISALWNKSSDQAKRTRALKCLNAKIYAPIIRCIDENNNCHLKYSYFYSGYPHKGPYQTSPLEQVQTTNPGSKWPFHGLKHISNA